MASTRARRRKRVVFEHGKEYAATVDLLVGLTYVGQISTPLRHRKLKPDKFGGILTFGTPTKSDLSIWESHRSTDKRFLPSSDLRVLFRYTHEAEWADHIKWWHWSEAVARVIVSTLQVMGPFSSRVSYLYIVSIPELDATITQNDSPSRFMPATCHGTGFTSLRMPSDFSSFPSIYTRLFDLLAERMADLSRRTTIKKHEAHGSRLECSLYMYSCSMQPFFQQDIALRLHIAIESLFASKAMNQSTIALVSSLLLRDVCAPEQVLDWVRGIYSWRNRFVHGDEPPYQYPNGSKYVQDMREAATGATYLLTALYERILESDALLSIFGTPLSEQDFLKQVFQYTTTEC